MPHGYTRNASGIHRTQCDVIITVFRNTVDLSAVPLRPLRGCLRAGFLNVISSGSALRYIITVIVTDHSNERPSVHHAIQVRTIRSARPIVLGRRVNRERRPQTTVHGPEPRNRVLNTFPDGRARTATTTRSTFRPDARIKCTYYV